MGALCAARGAMVQRPALGIRLQCFHQSGWMGMQNVLNSIEKMWSKIKTKLKEDQATNIDTPFSAIKNAFSLVTPANAKGWLQSCGYFQ